MAEGGIGGSDLFNLYTPPDTPMIKPTNASQAVRRREERSNSPLATLLTEVPDFVKKSPFHVTATAGVSVQVVTGLTGDFQPNASLVVVATPDVGNRDQTRSCPCDCLFDLLFNKMSKTLQSHSFLECNWKKLVT